MKKSVAHFLHIRKTGGTAIKEALKNINKGKKYYLSLHAHKTRLCDIPEGEKVFFFLRDPVTRFVSGFNSRLRQGWPMYNSPWNNAEQNAFSLFPTANALAEALYFQSGKAQWAMRNIRHVNSSYADWFDSIEYLKKRKDDILFIGFQESFDQDFHILINILGLPEYITLPKDEVLAHKTPEEYDVSLSCKAIENLSIWYKKDYEFYQFCKNLKVSSKTIKAETMNRASETLSPQKMNAKIPDWESSLNIRSDTDKVLELTQYWTPPVPPWQPLKKTLNSSLRMACLVEDKLYQGLRFEGEVMLLSPLNWRHALKHGKPDFLIMESIWNTATGHWHMGQCPNANGRDELLEIVFLARKLSIPTVFWFTRGCEYHEHYKEFAKHFDFVFCADPAEAESLRDEGIQAQELLPCVQPAIYNPFRHYDHYNDFSLNIL